MLVRLQALLSLKKNPRFDHHHHHVISILNNKRSSSSSSSSATSADGDVRAWSIDTEPQLGLNASSSSLAPLPGVSLLQSFFAVETESSPQFLQKITSSAHFSTYIMHPCRNRCEAVRSLLKSQSAVVAPFSSLCSPRSNLYRFRTAILRQQHSKHMSNVSVTLKTDSDVVRFCFDKSHSDKNGAQAQGRRMPKRVKMSKKAKVNELRLYRLKAKKKITSPNPEVRIRYKLEKAKRKEAWLIEKLRKFEVPKLPAETYDPESLTEEEMFYLKRTGEKKKNYVPVGRRGVFGGVVLNMHLHWKKHETVKVICKPCKPGQVHEYADELSRLSKGIVIDIKSNNTIIFYRGKNYVQPEVMSPPDTLNKNKAMEKYKFEQSLEHTSQFIEKLEKELEEYHKHIARYRKGKEAVQEDRRKISNDGDNIKE